MRRFEENPVHLTLETPEEPVRIQPKRLNPLYQSCKVMMFSENGGFTFGEKEKSSHSSGEKQELQNANFIKLKRFNLVKASLMVSQKRSTSNPKNPENKLNASQNDCINCGAKSENSICIDDQKAEHSISNKSQEFEKISINEPEQDLQTYYIKKIRVLEGKVKKYKLDSETQLMKIENENKKLRSSINIYQSFVKKYNYQLLSKIEKAIIEREDKLFSDSSSNSSIGDQKITPILSQVMELKIEGKRLCDHIKALENNIKLEQSINLKLKEEVEKLNAQKFVPNNNSLRKWSVKNMISMPHKFPHSPTSSHGKKNELLNQSFQDPISVNSVRDQNSKASSLMRNSGTQNVDFRII